MCIGPVELAAAGVAVALFNQASRITIFPLVSITTSFVAEEDTIKNIKLAAETQFSENMKANEVMPDDHLLEDMEKGASNKNSETAKETLAASGDTKEIKEYNGDGTFSLSLSGF